MLELINSLSRGLEYCYVHRIIYKNTSKTVPISAAKQNNIWSSKQAKKTIESLVNQETEGAVFNQVSDNTYDATADLNT